MSSVIRIVLGVLICGASLAPRQCWASAKKQPTSTCGIYSLYAAAKVQGADIRIDRLLLPRFISGPNGSTFRDVCDAAHEIGLNTVAFGDLSSSDLRSSPVPLILHMRSGPSAPIYDHYLLYLRCDGDKAVIVDDGKLRSVDFPKVVALWDRAAIAVSAVPINRIRLIYPSLMLFTCWTLVVLIVAVAVSLMPARLLICNALLQMITILALGAVVGVLHNFISDGGLLVDLDTVANVEQWHADAFLKRISASELQQEISDHTNITVVDIRTSEAYKTGHIDKAINIPWPLGTDAIPPEFSRHTREALVLYCQSDRCSASLRAARALLVRGYSNVRVYEGGWDEWRSTPLRKR